MNRKTNQQQFDNEIKALAQGVYQENEEVIPKSWINFAEHKNNKTGFYGQAFYKDGKIVISFRGTESRVRSVGHTCPTKTYIFLRTIFIFKSVYY